MDVCKANIQSDRNLDKLKLRIVVRWDLHNKKMVGYNCSPIASMRTLKYFLTDAAKHKERVNQLDFIGAFLKTKVIEDQNEVEPVTPCMDVYKAKIQYDGSLDKLKLSIVVRVDLHDKEMVGDTWSPTASMRNLKHFLADAAKHIARYYQLYFIGALL